MTPDKVHRLDALASQLAETLMTATICTQEIQAAVRTEMDHPGDHRRNRKWRFSLNGSPHEPELKSQADGLMRLNDLS